MVVAEIYMALAMKVHRRLTRNPHTSSDSDQWGTDREGSIPNEIGRRRLVLNPPKKRDVDTAPQTSEPAKTRLNPSAMHVQEEVLAKKVADWKQVNYEYEMKNTSRPASSHSSKQVGRGCSMWPLLLVKSRFDNAKSCEVILEEKGVDWKKVELDLEHNRVERSETNEERLQKEEINHLKSLTIETDGGSKLEQLSMFHNEIASKEKDLELMACQ
ncbi:hypothetical protein ZIOFF_010615 [Zingiber officinale]|uniref:Uncharacterized protein n=1 Tax=Zingiber officinale TaxID=94328 RepID=A0A8J5LPG4_ZINOF|nr:hypothetical protein ZIOFF_010615 [Zingiber officinale]